MSMKSVSSQILITLAIISSNIDSCCADVATNAWGPDGATRTALFVPCDLADPDAGVVALDPGDYEVLPVLVGTIGGGDDVIPF